MNQDHRKSDGDKLVHIGFKLLAKGASVGIAAGWAAGVAQAPLTPVLAAFAGAVVLALAFCITGQWMRDDASGA